MKLVNKNIKATLIALFLILVMAAPLIALPPIVNGQVVTTVLNHIYVSASPIAGVGKEMFLVYFTDRIVPDIGETAGTATSPNGRAGWDNIQFIVTRPDGTNETINCRRSDPIGSDYYAYVPTQTGVYSVKAIFPAVWKNHTTGTSRQFYPYSESAPTNFTVREQAVLGWPDVPLPNDYWMRPIPGPANSWYVLAGNWLGGAANNYPLGSGGVTPNYGYGTAPESPHILWTRQNFPTGEIEDERFGSLANRYGGYQAVSWSVDPILDGQIHTTHIYSVHDNAGGYAIWDLYTGEELYFNASETKPANGQILHYDTGNEHGLAVYMWKTSGITLPDQVRIAKANYDGPNKPPVRYAADITVNKSEIIQGTLRELIDGYTGNTVCYIANVSTTGTNIYGADGSILYYNAVNLGNSTNPNYYLQVWNSSAGTMVSSHDGTGYWQYRPSGGTFGGSSPYFSSTVTRNNVHDGSLMWSLNASMPSLFGPSNSLVNQTATILAIREGKYIVVGTQGRNDERGIVPGWMMGVSLVRGQEGQKLWESTFTPPFSSTAWYSATSFVGINPETEVIIFDDETQVINPIVYDLKTGKELWRGDNATEPQFSYYGFQNLQYKDMIISGGSHSGVLLAQDARTGELRWKYVATVEGTESPYGNALTRGFTVSDGKLYTSVSEHSPSSPLWRSPGLRCLNITTGEEIWKILFWGASMRIADGILLGWNWYDGQVYAFGKGPSATTVSAPQIVPTLGSSVTIVGTVTDQSPSGRRNINNLLEFSLKDTPAISDKDMQAWMQYKFMGQAFPTDAEGVEVVLSAIDPNGNNVPIGTVTSDMNGNYGIPYSPEIPGTYQIIATFAGTNSYYPSSATTYLTVADAPAATTAPTQIPLSTADLYFVPATIAIIIAIVAIGLVIILMLRKRP